MRKSNRFASASSVGVMLSVCGLAAGGASAQISFSAPTIYPAVQRPSATVAGDFDGDGDNDLAVTVDNPDRVLVMFNNGAGVFGAPTPYFLGAGAGADTMAVGDFDLDGDLDIAVSLSNLNTVRILVNAGAGTFTLGAAGAPTGIDARDLSAADIDGDGDLDLLTANRDSNNVSILRNAGGAFTTTSLPAGAEPRATATGDFDADGDLDLVVTNHDDRNVMVFVNGGAGNFAGPTIYPVGGNVRPEGVETGDFNADGRVDFVVAISDDIPALNAIGLFTNTGAGAFSGPANFPTGGSNTGGVVVADLDLDGDLDVAANNEDSSNISVLTNTGGAFGPALLLGAGVNPETPTVARFNADTRPDLAVASRDSNTVGVYFNTTPVAACPADFNGDGAANVQDVLAFLAAFSAADPRADFNGDGAINIQDFLAFLGVFGAGCP